MTDPCFSIGSVPVLGDLVLAPMAGYSDSPNRLLARRFGSALSYTEFVNAIDIVQDLPLVSQRFTFSEPERPVVFQVFDNHPLRIIKAVEMVLRLNPDIIDINLGCSARCVSNRGAGAGLLKSPEKIKEIFTGLIKISPVPVTAKMRLGWDENSRNYLEVAKLLEDHGAAMIAVHGRTRSQAYTGKSDWIAIGEIKQTVSIPVIANGDVRTVADIERIKSITGCDAVMIGRGAIGNPWLFSRIDRASISLQSTIEVMLEHLTLMDDFYGQSRGHILFRKHLKAYLEPYHVNNSLLNSLVTAPDIVNLKENLIALHTG